MASAPGWLLPLVRDELSKAVEAGEDVAFDRLQAQVGAGASDLQAALDELREAGEAVEEAPGVWRGPYMDEGASPPPEPPDDVAEALEREDEERRGTRWARGGHGGTVETRLTAGMLTHLDPEAIGQLVLAGVADSDARPFVLRIDP